MKTIIGEIKKEDTIFAESKSKKEIDVAIQKVIESRINSGRMRVEDNQKLIALGKRIIEDVKATNTPIRTWLRRLI